jgi:hypothetical protein
MSAFSIRFENWTKVPEFGTWHSPLFFIYREHQSEPLIAVGVLLPSLRAMSILRKIDAEDEKRVAQLKQALLRYGIRRIEQGLQNSIFSDVSTGDTQWIDVPETDEILLEQLLQEKTCTYQIKDGRDVLCSAAASNDSDAIGQIGFRTVAPTSLAI